jgi:hypothetical protein
MYGACRRRWRSFPEDMGGEFIGRGGLTDDWSCRREGREHEEVEKEWRKRRKNMYREARFFRGDEWWVRRQEKGGHWSCRGDRRCRGEGRELARERGKEWGEGMKGKKEERGKSWWSAGQLVSTNHK